jgi:hypothetical protein
MHPALELLHPIISIAWILFGLSVVGCGIWLAYAHLRQEAGFFYFGGLVLLGSTVVVIYPALMRTHLGEDVRKLQDLAYIAREDLDAERTARVQDRRTLIQQSQQVSEAKARQLALESNIASEQKEHQRAKDAAARQNDAYAQASKRAAARHMRLRAVLSNVRRSLVRERLAHAKTALLYEQLTSPPGSVADWLVRGIESERFSINRHEGELVRGYEGQFYKIELFKAPNIGFIFGPRQFTLGFEEPKFIECLKSLSNEVLIRVRQSANAELLLRGRADAGGPLGTLSTQHEELRRVEYLTAVEDRIDLFSSRLSVQMIPAEYHNDHLPLLRSAYIRNLVRQVDPAIPVIVLQGDARGIASTDRRVDIYLHVSSWPLP